MTVKELEERKAQRFARWHYTMKHYRRFDYDILSEMFYTMRPGKDRSSYNEVIIMGDTETSKKRAGSVDFDNHIVAWTISIRAFNKNIVTLYGHDPREMVDCFTRIQSKLPGENTIVYFHNLAYDWTFLELFFFEVYGHPVKQLNTKPHYPISIVFANGLILRDSLILAQRSLDKWAKDLDVEHQKAIGKWDYDKLRNQHGVGTTFSAGELEYIEHDTLAGVECLNKLKNILNKHCYNMPYTATGIPREDVRSIGKENHAKDLFNRMVLTYKQYRKMEQCYHGGFTHANRHYVNQVVGSKDNPVKCYDFSSSYPFCMLAFKYPMEKFTSYKDCSIDFILQHCDNYAFAFKLVLKNVELKSYWYGMPSLQLSKCVKIVNPIVDNGRILKADYVEIYLLDPDLEVIANHYKCTEHICTEVEMAHKDYLPRWFTDYVFKCYEDKTLLKDTGDGNYDPVAYALSKSKLNALYGMCVMKNVKETIAEDYSTGEYYIEEQDCEELYNKYVKQINTILPYQWGCYVTSYAFRNLNFLSKCCELHVYSDTDSCYGIGWNEEKITAYNESCKKALQANNYGCVYFNNREYWLGIAELDGVYSEFKTQGAKRYCCRSVKDNELHITVAGVPKAGYLVLNDDINKFAKGLIFPGTVTGKKTHTYINVPEIYQDSLGNWTGNSIDLSPCDYLLDSIERYDWDLLFEEEVTIQYYDESTT